jgi:uncharacterized protein YigE (DUF2233 family)
MVRRQTAQDEQARPPRRAAPRAQTAAARPIWTAFAAAILAVLGGITAHAAPIALGPSGTCRDITFAGASYTVCSADLRTHEVKLFWKGRDGEPYGSFDRLRAQPEGSRLVFAMNAGMYHPDLSPVGLYIEGGREMKRTSTASGPGNFHMKPNGIVYVSGETAGVIETGRYLRSKPRAEMASQSGPMLVIDGRIHPRISARGISHKIRNGVGVRERHLVVFAISNEPVTFGAFARLFRDGLGCANALFLDGSISSLYAPARGRNDRSRPLGPIIGAVERRS